MELRVRGDEVQGWYGSQQQWCQLWGSAREGRLEFHYREASESGSGTFTLSPDGRHFEGTYLASGQVSRRTWVGRRLRPNRPFDGLWNTSCGMLRLVREGDSVRGLLQGHLRHARVAGTVDGRVCTLAGAFDGGLLQVLEHLGVGHAASVEAAVAASVARTGDRAVAVVPEGPYVVPVCGAG
jgi:hypothetical protein